MENHVGDGGLAASIKAVSAKLFSSNGQNSPALAHQQQTRFHIALHDLAPNVRGDLGS